MSEEQKKNQLATGSYIAQADQGSHASVTIIQRLVPPSNICERRNRNRLLNKVSIFWIKGVLENSLHGIALCELGMEYRPDAVTYPWEMILQKPDAPQCSIQPGTKIVDVFDRQNGELLILGAPGSGKTTMLLDLAQSLIARAQDDDAFPIPVIFNLSSWAKKQLPIAEWLVEELNIRYDVPIKVGEKWIGDGFLIPMLDGLDEVIKEHRAECTEAINAFRSKHGLLNIVVCSRIADYEDLDAKLKLQGAVFIQPLTLEQIDTYLKNAGEQLAALRLALNKKSELRDLAQTPLMLSIMAMVYRGETVETLPTNLTPEGQRTTLFATYIDRMFIRRGAKVKYTSHQTVQCLTWLAQQMNQHGQAVFSIEQMQPDWLESPEKQRRYKKFLNRGIIFLKALPFVLIIGIFSGLIEGIVAGMFGILLVGIKHEREKIILIDSLNWSWTNMSSNFSTNFIGGLNWGVIVGCISVFLGDDPIVAIGLGATVGIISGLAFALTEGLVWNEVEKSNKPNQGIWRSIRSSIFGGVLRGSIFGMASIVFIGLRKLIHLPITDEIWVMLWWSIAGFVGGFFTYGGLTCFQHVILRFMLWRSKVIPWKFARFLNYAVERIFLRRVGGGYIFIHRLLLEHFTAIGQIIEIPKTDYFYQEEEDSMDFITHTIIEALAKKHDKSIRESFNILNACILNEFGKDSELSTAIVQLEKKPLSHSRRKILEEAVAITNASQHQEIIELTTSLNETIKGFINRIPDKYAGFLRRSIACIIDAIVLLSIVAIVFLRIFSAPTKPIIMEVTQWVDSISDTGESHFGPVVVLNVTSNDNNQQHDIMPNILAGDIITHINDEPTTGNFFASSTWNQFEEDSVVKLSIIREGDEESFNVSVPQKTISILRSQEVIFSLLRVVAWGIAMLVVLLNLYWLYFAFLESSPTQATLGKMIVGIVVTDLNGNRVSFSTASGRYWSKIASGATLLFGFLMTGFTRKKQALHDIMAGCLVLKK